MLYIGCKASRTGLASIGGASSRECVVSAGCAVGSSETRQADCNHAGTGCSISGHVLSHRCKQRLQPNQQASDASSRDHMQRHDATNSCCRDMLHAPQAVRAALGTERPAAQGMHAALLPPMDTVPAGQMLQLLPP